MTPRELLSKLKEENGYYFKAIRKYNIKRFCKFILPGVLISLMAIYLNFLPQWGYRYYKPHKIENVQITSMSMQDEMERERCVYLKPSEGGFKLNGLFDVCDVNGQVKEIVHIKDTDDLYTYHFEKIVKHKDGRIELVGVTDTFHHYEFWVAFVFVLLLLGVLTTCVIFLVDLGIFIFLMIADKDTYWVSYSTTNDLWTSLFYIPDYSPRDYDVPVINYIWMYCKEFFGYPLTEQYVYDWLVRGEWDLQRTWRKYTNTP